MMYSGTGPGTFTDDGCSVELYRRLQPGDEPDVISSVVPAGATILELGAGAGRVTHPLVERGFIVTAVDSSAEMLGHIAGADTIASRIETLALDRSFDAVLLGSHLVNTPDDLQRQAFLQTCRRHVAASGVILIETYVPERIRPARDGLLDERDGIRCSLRDFARDGDSFSATVVYETADATWTQSFSARIFDEFALSQQLQPPGLAFGAWLDHLRSWFSAMPTRA